MPLISLLGTEYRIQAPGGATDHIQDLKEAFTSQSGEDDLTLYCQNKSAIKTNKFPLLFSSKLFAKILMETCHCPTKEYEVICPDFDPDSMAGVLDLINTGATSLDGADSSVYIGMLYIIECLQINLKIAEVCFKAPSAFSPRPTTTAVSKSESVYQNKTNLTHNCQICSETFQLLTDLQSHEKQHSLVDSGLDYSKSYHDEDNSVDLSTNYITEYKLENVDAAMEQPSFEDLDEGFDNFEKYYDDMENCSFQSPTKHSKTSSSGQNFNNSLKISSVSKKNKEETTKKQELKVNAENLDPKKAKTFTCPLCPKTTKTHSHLLVHVAKVHFKKEFFMAVGKHGTSCIICSKEILNRKHLESHYILGHRYLNQIIAEDFMKELDGMGSRRRKSESFKM